MADSPTTALRVGTSYVEWGSIIAGTAAAVALSFVLLSAGAAIGLSLLSPYPSNVPAKAAETLATAWMLFVTIGSFLIGGYIAGRLRMTLGEGNPDEVVFRDGMHGLLVWSVAILMGGLLAIIAGSSTTLVGTHVEKTSIYSSQRGMVLSRTVDAMLRGSTAPSAAMGQLASSDQRDEVTRILTASLSAGQMAGPDRTYLLQIVAQRSGLSPAEAEKRVDAAYADAVNTMEKARQRAVLAGLVTTTALLFGLVAAWYAAQRGGHHRDHNIPAKFGPFRRPDLTMWVISRKDGGK
jgi:hypothetical protein